MSYLKKKLRCLVLGLIWLEFIPVSAQQTGSLLSLQQLLNSMQSNYDLIKYQSSLVQARQAEKKAVTYNRLPRFNTMLQAGISSDNNVEGAYQSYGLIPSLVGGSRLANNLSAISNDEVMAGLNWEAVNFGAYKAREGVAKSNLQVQTNQLASTSYELNGMASAYYLELMRQFELQKIEQDNVNRLQQLKTSIGALVGSGTRPGVDSMIANAELSRSLVGYHEAQKNFAQTQVQLSTLTGLTFNALQPDTGVEGRLLNEGPAYAFSSVVDTLHHPYINLYSSMYDLSKSRLKLEKSNYYPKIFVDADAWMRGSSLSNADVYNNNLGDGFAPSRFNYMFALTFTYDIFNIVHKHLNSAVSRFESEAAYHQLQNEKVQLNDEVQKALLEKDFQLGRLSETANQLKSAGAAYNQQLSLYNSGLSSLIDLNTALTYYINAQKDYVDAKVGLMKSILNYSLVTNSFTGLVQTLKL